jgi:DNA repair exonuclease SbcCD nuclease subunit
MISTFLRSLADIAPTFIIAGNHDCNLNNKDRLDVLLPIIELLNHNNLYYLKDTGIYSLPQYDLDFIVFSVFDNPENYFPVNESNASKKICLYHGVVDGCILDNGMAMTTNHMTLDNFIGADITMLGDIHKYQTLQDYKLEELEIDESELTTYISNGWQIK